MTGTDDDGRSAMMLPIGEPANLDEAPRADKPVEHEAPQTGAPHTGAAFVARHGEALAGLALAAVGLWIATRGGWFLAGVGLAVAALGLGWAVVASRRARFRHGTSAPGLVEVIEGRIGYFGAGTVMGGEIGLDELAEIRLMTLRSGRSWRLRTLDGQALLIPLGAAGSEALYDAFAALPGIDMGRLSAALAETQGAEASQSLWLRPMLRPGASVATLR